MDIDVKKGCERVLTAMSRHSLSGVENAREVVLAAIRLDCEYMDKAKVHEGMPYDDEAAFSHIARGLKKSFPQLPNAPAVTDDYMDAWESYLESEGLIDWD